MRRQVFGLDAEQLQRALPPSDMTLGGMVKHLAYVENWWLRRVLDGDTSGWPAEFDSDVDWDWHSAAQDSPSELLAIFDREIADADVRIDAALKRGGLDEITTRPAKSGADMSLRWIVVHLIREYARHAGHADLIRESIDGAVDL